MKVLNRVEQNSHIFSPAILGPGYIGDQGLWRYLVFSFGVTAPLLVYTLGDPGSGTGWSW